MATKTLLEQFLSRENFIRAYRRIAGKNASGGIDRVSVEDFARHLDRNIQKLQKQIIEGQYTPQPVKSVHIPKFNQENEWRELGLPAVADKIVQTALLQAVEPIAEKLFLDTNYGYRPGKGHYKAIRRVEHNLKNRHKTWIVHRDIDNFFDTLNHDLLLSRFSDLVKGEPILTELVALWCRMGLVEKNGRWRNVEAGVRQGHVISPFLANLYLHTLDEFVTEFDIGWVRYADDYLIQCSSKEDVVEVDENVIAFLKNNLSLSINNNPNPVSNLEGGFTFLGVYFCGEKRSIAAAKLDKIHRKIKWLSSDKRSQTPEAFMLRIDKMLQGLKRYYGFLNPVEQFSEIDKMVENEIVPFIANHIKKGQWPQKPPAGFLHCFQDGKPVLVYDLIEEFRAMAVDRGIFTLLHRGEKLTQEDDGALSSETRKKIARIVIGRLSSETYLSGSRMILEDVIREQALNIKKHVTGTSNYKPFLSRW
ncbi:MAG: reverse transcriptase domain-containing protein [Nitrospirota bacterium]